jgi:prepilin-type N-terminal cleavage/methylation domain-containing protein
MSMLNKSTHILSSHAHDTLKKNQQKGYSIIELSIALAIVSIILVTALTGVQRILRSNNVNEDLKKINLAASKIGVILANVPDATGITQQNLINLKVFSDFSTVPGAGGAAPTINNSFGGTITVAPNTATLGTIPANGGLMLYSTLIPPEACSDYISGLAPISSHISAQNNAVVGAGAALTNVVKTNLAPLTVNSLATACTAAAGNTISVAILITK